MINRNPEQSDNSNHNHKEVVLIVGIDSADPLFIEQMIAEGYLPNLQGLIHEGFKTDLITTKPDMTPPAWTSLVTGVNPGRHNVFGFTQPTGSSIKVTESVSRKAPTIWEKMDPACGKVLMNVPISYPARQINGCMISDSLTLLRSGVWAWPSEEEKRLLASGYDVCFISHVAEVKNLQQLVNSSKIRGRAFLDLLDRYNWCFAMIVFSETDWVQHIFPDNKTKILKVYSAVDDFIGNLVRKLNRETLLLVVSDHGYKVANRKFFVNNWFIERDLLRIRNSRLSKHSLADSLIGDIGAISPRMAQFVPRRLREKLARKLDSPTDNIAMLSGLYHIGWDMGQYLRIYITEDQKEGYEEYYRRLSDESSKLVDPANGIRPIKAVLRKSEVYSGPYSIFAPDFILELEKMYSGNERIFNSKKHFLSYKTGVHNERGILLGKWYNSDRQCSDSRKRSLIYDVAPTVLSVFGRTSYSDGQPIASLIKR